VVILAGLWVSTRRKAKEAQRRTELEQKALRAQMNPHFIFNSLGAIQEMYMSGDTDLANNYLGDFGKLLRKILENSGKETTTLKEEMEMLRLYLGLEKERNSGMIEYAIEMDERLDLSGTRIPPMIIQPFVENAIWHGILPSRRKGKITIRIKPTANAQKLICEIEDNGVGIDQSPKQKERASMGIHITEQRLGTRALIANLAPGTLVTLQIPL
jgi:sensor histidine kinase YesM